jgi:hypothetical protein
LAGLRRASETGNLTYRMRKGHPAPDEGIKFLNQLRAKRIYLPFSLSAGISRIEVPPHAFGITDRVDELINLLFDAF